MRKLFALLLLPAFALADITVTASFNPSPGSESFTLYQVAEDGTPVQVGTGTASPITATVPDFTTAAFVITASNEAGESAFSAPVYVQTQKGPVNITLPPNTPIQLNITYE